MSNFIHARLENSLFHGNFNFLDSTATSVLSWLSDQSSVNADGKEFIIKSENYLTWIDLAYSIFHASIERNNLKF